MSLFGRIAPLGPVRCPARDWLRSTPFPLLLEKVPPALPRLAPSIAAHPLSPAAYCRVLRASYSPFAYTLAIWEVHAVNQSMPQTKKRRNIKQPNDLSSFHLGNRLFQGLVRTCKFYAP